MPQYQRLVRNTRLPDGWSMQDDFDSKTEGWKVRYETARKKNKHLRTYTDLSKVDHSYNSHGFRGPEITNLDAHSVVYLGCSHTAGTGLALEDTWSWKLHQARFPDLEYVNAGVGGGDIESCVNMLWYVHDSMLLSNVRHVFALVPPYHRSNVFVSDNTLEWVSVNPTIPSSEYKDSPAAFEYANNWLKLYTDKTALKVAVNQLMLLYYICVEKSIQLSWAVWEQDNRSELLPYLPGNVMSKYVDIHAGPVYGTGEIEIAADYMHYSSGWHSGIAQAFEG